jgi:hypothetical protein
MTFSWSPFPRAAKASSSGSSGGAALPADNYISGNYYEVIPNAFVAASSVTTAGEISLMPFVLRTAVTIKALMARVIAVSAGGNFGLAIYAHNPTTGRPTGLPLASIAGLSTATATNVTGTLGSPVTLVAGTYWAAVIRDNGVVTLLSLNASVGWTGALIGSATAANVLSATTAALSIIVAGGTYPTFTDMTSASFTEVATSRAALIAFQVN